MLTSRGARISAVGISSTTSSSIPTGSVLFGLFNYLSFNYLRGYRGRKPPARDFFMAFYYDLSVFKQDEMRAKKSKGRTS
jgi:hypothetical protein